MQAKQNTSHDRQGHLDRNAYLQRCLGIYWLLDSQGWDTWLEDARLLPGNLLQQAKTWPLQQQEQLAVHRQEEDTLPSCLPERAPGTAA